MHNDTFEIDDEAKFLVPLKSRTDSRGNTFYTGKLQFNGTLSMSKGQTFMIFTSEKGVEEMQVGPLHPTRAYKVRDVVMHSDSRVSISLSKFQDRNEEVYYIGELKGLGDLPMDRGYFFTIFTSIEGREELQISPLRVRRRVHSGDRHNDTENEDDELKTA